MTKPSTNEQAAAQADADLGASNFGETVEGRTALITELEAELLAALKEMLGALSELWDEKTFTEEAFDNDPSVKHARAAIAKAEGR